MIGSFVRPANAEIYRKMIIYRYIIYTNKRCNNLGMKELDISLGGWAKKNAHTLSYEDCQQFESEVLDHETPDLFYLVLK
jgi:succinate dehydrogenase flavin-adding protein (antitoxin of CptAB toxin-antitoxin module)